MQTCTGSDSTWIVFTHRRLCLKIAGGTLKKAAFTLPVTRLCTVWYSFCTWASFVRRMAKNFSPHHGQWFFLQNMRTRSAGLWGANYRDRSVCENLNVSKPFFELPFLREQKLSLVFNFLQVVLQRLCRSRKMFFLLWKLQCFRLSCAELCHDFLLFSLQLLQQIVSWTKSATKRTIDFVSGERRATYNSTAWTLAERERYRRRTESHQRKTIQRTSKKFCNSAVLCMSAFFSSSTDCTAFVASSISLWKRNQWSWMMSEQHGLLWRNHRFAQSNQHQMWTLTVSSVRIPTSNRWQDSPSDLFHPPALTSFVLVPRGTQCTF